MQMPPPLLVLRLIAVEPNTFSKQILFAIGLQRKQKFGDPAFLVEISQNEARVLKTLVDSAGKSNLEDLSMKSGLADSAVARAVLNLSQNKLVRERIERRAEWSLKRKVQTVSGRGAQ